jgi:hypothetical protein
MSRSDMRSLIVQCIPVLTQSSWSVMCTTPVIRIFQGLSLGFPHGRWGPCRRFFFFLSFCFLVPVRNSNTHSTTP